MSVVVGAPPSGGVEAEYYKSESAAQPSAKYVRPTIHVRPEWPRTDDELRAVLESESAAKKEELEVQKQKQAARMLRELHERQEHEREMRAIDSDDDSTPVNVPPPPVNVQPTGLVQKARAALDELTPAGAERAAAIVAAGLKSTEARMAKLRDEMTALHNEMEGLRMLERETSDTYIVERIQNAEANVRAAATAHAEAALANAAKVRAAPGAELTAAEKAASTAATTRLRNATAELNRAKATLAALRAKDELRANNGPADKAARDAIAAEVTVDALEEENALFKSLRMKDDPKDAFRTRSKLALAMQAHKKITGELHRLHVT